MIEQAASGLNTPAPAKVANKFGKLGHGDAKDQGKEEFGKLVADAAGKTTAKSTTADTAIKFAATVQVDPRIQKIATHANVLPEDAVSIDVADKSLSLLQLELGEDVIKAAPEQETVPEQKPASRLNLTSGLTMASRLGRQNDDDKTVMPDSGVYATKNRTAEKDERTAKSAVMTETVTTAVEISRLLGVSTQGTEGEADQAKVARKLDHTHDDAREAKADDSAIDIKHKAELPTHAENIHAVQETAGEHREQVKSDTQAPETSTVRLVSADGKGKALDIPVSKSVDDAAPNADARTAGPKIDVVTVLEARRYLGFSPDSNAGALTTAIKSDHVLSQAISRVSTLDPLAATTTTEVNTLKLQMNPDNLGSMVASLKLKGDELTVEVHVQTIEAYRQMSSDQDGIVKALQDQGFNIDTVTVQLVASDTKADSNADRGDQTRQGQNLKEGQGENARERQDDARRPAQQDTWHSDDDKSSSNRADGKPDLSRSGNVYL